MKDEISKQQQPCFLEFSNSSLPSAMKIFRDWQKCQGPKCQGQIIITLI